MIYLNGKLVNTTLFPDNTSQVWKIGRQPPHCNIDEITLRPRDQASSTQIFRRER